MKKLTMVLAGLATVTAVCAGAVRWSDHDFLGANRVMTYTIPYEGGTTGCAAAIGEGPKLLLPPGRLWTSQPASVAAKPSAGSSSSASYSPMTAQRKPIMMKKPLNRAMSANPP